MLWDCNCRLEFKIDRLLVLASLHCAAQYKLTLATPRRFSLVLRHRFVLGDANHHLKESNIGKKKEEENDDDNTQRYLLSYFLLLQLISLPLIVIVFCKS